MKPETNDIGWNSECRFGEHSSTVNKQTKCSRQNESCKIHDENVPVEPANACGIAFRSGKVSSL